MDLQQEVRPFRQPRRDPVRQHARSRTNRPAPEPLRIALPVAVDHADRSHPAEPGTAVRAIERRHAAARHVREDRVVHDLAGAGTILDAAHPLVLGESRRDHEVAEDIRTRWHARRIRPASRARGPACPVARTSAANSGSFGIRRSSPRGIPCFTHAAMVEICCVGQPPLADELAEVRVAVPRRHVARAGHARDQRAALGHILVRDQRERRGFTRPMTRDAVGVDDRRDASVKVTVDDAGGGALAVARSERVRRRTRSPPPRSRQSNRCRRMARFPLTGRFRRTRPYISRESPRDPAM